MNSNKPRRKLAVIATHPIQYQAPLWRKLAQNTLLDIKVYYADRHGSVESYDPLYGKSFSWDIPLLDGYDYEFLRSIKIPGLPGPTACYYPINLHKKLSEGNFDAIFLHGYMNGAAWAGYLSARKLGIPIFIRGDSHLVDRNTSGVRAWVKKTLLSRFLRSITWCLAIGKWNASYWNYYGVAEEKIYTSLFSIDNARFGEKVEKNLDEIKELRNKWNVKKTDSVFIFSGNVLTHKGIDILIDAFLLLQKKRNNTHLIIIGEGLEKERLQAYTNQNEKIHWMGFINQSKMPIYLGAADIFVLPSRYEPWGLVVNEALACGLPCIVSNVVGSGPDMISAANTGLIFSDGDVDDLATKMEQACEIELQTIWKKNIPAILDKASYDQNVNVIVNCINTI